jgi:kinetochor protein Mis14/NSL1
MELDTTTTHPHPHPHPHHRKIELQSALDLAYLQSNMSASVRQKLDLHFPLSASQPPPLPSATQHDAAATAGPDPMRQRVEDLVAQFLDRVWRAAKANIAVNGQDATTTTAFWGGPTEPPYTKDGGGTREQEEEEREREREGVDFEYEPYDARLSARVAGLYAEVESLTAHVSRLRRTAPREAAERYAGVLGSVLEEEFGDGDGDGDGAGAGARAGGLLRLDVVRDGWEEDVAAAYDRGVEELRRLGGLAGGGLGLDDGEGSGSGGGSLTETVGRVQRAKTVALELE